ncbi:MAG: diphthine--ammonia ligase [Chloroflexi bacterium]|nr:diphthine--ammonia ligase [Chloroflexota bacterium]
MRVIVSWSGGKDSCLACYKAQSQGYEVVKLVNAVSKEFKRVSFHGTRAHLIHRQAEATGIPVYQYSSADEERFKRAVARLKKDGIEGMVFGDIYVDEHRQWIERVCSELEIKPVLPLWGIPTGQVLREFIDLGFKAVVISANADIFSDQWLGRFIDYKFMEDIKKLKWKKIVDVCGEEGEYHTLVVDGPLFRQSLSVTYGVRIQRPNGYRYLDITRSKLMNKVVA